MVLISFSLREEADLHPRQSLSGPWSRTEPLFLFYNATLCVLTGVACLLALLSGTHDHNGAFHWSNLRQAVKSENITVRSVSLVHRPPIKLSPYSFTCNTWTQIQVWLAVPTHHPSEQPNPQSLFTLNERNIPCSTVNGKFLLSQHYIFRSENSTYPTANSKME